MKIWHENHLTDCPSHLSDVATVPREIQKSHFQQYYSYILLITYTLSHKKTNCSPLFHPPENVTTLIVNCKTFFIWLKVCCILSNVGNTKKSRLWIVISSSEKNRLWCVATGMSGKQYHSKCSEWPPSALIHASSLFRHCLITYSTPRCTEIQPMSQQAAAASLNMSISIHALLLQRGPDAVKGYADNRKH